MTTVDANALTSFCKVLYNSIAIACQQRSIASYALSHCGKRTERHLLGVPSKRSVANPHLKQAQDKPCRSRAFCGRPEQGPTGLNPRACGAVSSADTLRHEHKDSLQRADGRPSSRWKHSVGKAIAAQQNGCLRGLFERASSIRAV